MTILAPFAEQNNRLAAVVEISGDQYQLKTDTRKTWLVITDKNGLKESMSINPDDLLHGTGERFFTEFEDEDQAAIMALIRQ